MARLYLQDPEVRKIADDLADVVIASRSVNAACERLSNALAGTGNSAIVYPNRIHSLLSEDATRALNETSVELIRTAVTTLKEAGYSPDEAGSEEFVAKVIEAWRKTDKSAAALRFVSSALAIPPAVVRRVLHTRGEAPRSDGESFPENRGVLRKSRVGPDWSFQDTAVKRSVKSLLAGSNRKVGLVLPTGGGKTRVALRIALELLSNFPGSGAPVFWVTHRKHLRSQAHRELQKMLSGVADALPPNAAKLLADRIEFIMLADLESRLQAEPGPLLVIVDEAHHAAAPSYKPLFDSAFPIRGLFLTATPNRTDELPIGIDEISYTITYRELAERGVIILPQFEDFPVPDFDWSEASVKDLADVVILKAANEYKKVLVLAPRINRVEDFYAALQDRLLAEAGHPLTEDDIGFVHSTGNSLTVHSDNGPRAASAEEFLAAFRDKPRAIIVSSQMLLEGFDDPEINTVVITYPSTSTIVLMQAAGRCVRFVPSKQDAFVLQASNDSIAYHLDHRWLYQEISDYLRPELLEIEYRNRPELLQRVEELLSSHNVSQDTKSKIREAVEGHQPGNRVRVLLSGRPFYGPSDRFAHESIWGAFLEDDRTGEGFRELFNKFCALGSDLSDPSDFLRSSGAKYGITLDLSMNSPWREYMEILTAMYFAKREIIGGAKGDSGSDSRPFVLHGATTWLKYVTFSYRPDIPPELDQFLEGCINRDDVLVSFQAAPDERRIIVKIRLPLRGFRAYVVEGAATDWWDARIAELRAILMSLAPDAHLGALEKAIAELDQSPVPLSLIRRMDTFLNLETTDVLELRLPVETSNYNPPREDSHA